LRPTLWVGRLDITMATRKKHTLEQVVRKLAMADRMLGEGKGVADVCREVQGFRADLLPVANSSAG
jgi:putative transposase